MLFGATLVFPLKDKSYHLSKVQKQNEQAFYLILVIALFRGYHK